MFLAKNDKLEVRSKHISNNHVWQLLGLSIFVILLFFAWNDEKETWERVKIVIFMVGGISYLLALIFNFNYNTSRFILRNNKEIYCQIPTKLDEERGKTYETNIDCISMAVFADSRDLIFYNREQEQDYVFDLSLFSRDDRQYIINILSQKIKVKIENKLAQEERLKLPTTDVFEESQNDEIAVEKPVQPRRRRVANAPAQKESVNMVEENVTSAVAEPKKTQSSKKGRKLEL